MKQKLKDMLSTINSRYFIQVLLVFGMLFLAIYSQKSTLNNIYIGLKEKEIEINSSVLQNIGDYYEKNFTYRKLIGHYNSVLKISFFNYSPTPKVIIGKSGMMFEGSGERRIEEDTVASFDNVSDYLGRLPYTNQELGKWAETIEQRRCWLEKKGIDYIFVIAPTKALVYPELLPNRILKIKSKLDKESRISVLERYLNENDVDVLNLTHKLKSEKVNHQRLFYRTDFHWNYLGAYFAYQAIAEQANAIYPNLEFAPLSLSQFEIENRYNWAHPRFLGILGIDARRYQNDTYVKMIPKTGNPLADIAPYNDGVYDKKNLYKEVVGTNNKKYKLEFIENPLGKKQKILIIGDSFIQKVFPYFSVNARESYYSRAVFQFPEHLINELKPKVVVQEILNMYLLRDPPVNKGEVAKAVCE